MAYAVVVFAENDHNQLQADINHWIRQEKPRRIHSINFVTNGSEYTYTALMLYAAEVQGRGVNGRTSPVGTRGS